MRLRKCVKEQHAAELLTATAVYLLTIKVTWSAQGRQLILSDKPE